MKARIKKEVLKVFSTEIDKAKPLETGGVLVGFFETNIIQICNASSPGPKADHEEIFFQADPDFVDMFIDMEHANSGGRYSYLGEWHTHPQIDPEPSEIDLKSLEEIASTAGSNFTILLIIGAVDYNYSVFQEQSILILKYSDDEKYYRLALEVC